MECSKSGCERKAMVNVVLGEDENGEPDVWPVCGEHVQELTGLPL